MNSERKAAILAYKEQKAPRGIFAMRCHTTGNVWVDVAMDLRAIENRTWFQLKLADIHIDKAIVDEFKTHGRESFTYEVLEMLADDIEPMALRDTLKERKLYWMEKLSGRTLSPM